MNQELSRILDEDVSEFETQRILKEYAIRSMSFKQFCSRYNIIGHVLRKELPAKLNQINLPQR